MTLGPKDKATEITNPSPVLYPREKRLLDDRIRVARPDVYPNRCAGQILIKIRNSNDWIQGSGSLVSDYTILTAGHVVKKSNNEFYDIEEFQFIPARNHSDMPYGAFDWFKMKAVYDGDSRDWALISLAQPAGFQIGFLGAMALYPISRYKTERYRFQHLGFPLDHADEMWIDQDGECTDIYRGQQLKTDIDAAGGQSGGPLTINWGPSNPKVCGCLSGGPNPVEDPNYFTPGYEHVKTDVWFQALCEEYGNMHSDDRFVSCGSLGDTMFTQGMLPNYNIPHVFSDDKGPVIRGFSPRYIESWMTPHRLSLMHKQEEIKKYGV